MDKIFSRKNAIFWIMALALILRLIALGKSFQGDEFSSIMDAGSFAGIPDALLSDTHPPLYFYLLHFWMKISMSEAFLRILSIIPGLGLCLAVYLIGRYAFSETAGTASALILAFSPVAVWSSQYIRTYSLAAFFTVISVYFLIRILKEERAGMTDWAAFALTSSLSIYTFYFSALVIIAENMFVLFFVRRKGFLKRWLVSQAVIAASYVPWIPYFIFQRSSYVGHPQMTGKVGFYIGNIHLGGLLRSISGLAGFDPRLFSKDMVSSYYLLKVAAIAAGFLSAAVLIWLVARSLRALKAGPAEGEAIRLLLFLAAVPFLLAILMHQALGIIVMSHYFLASYSFFVVALAAIFAGSMPRRIGLAVIAAVIAVYSIRLIGLYSDRETDFKSAHDHIKKTAAEGAVLIAPSFGGTFDYYFSDMPLKKHMEDLKDAKFSAADVIAITYPAKLELKETDRRFRSIMSSGGYKAVSSVRFGDLIVERYTKR